MAPGEEADIVIASLVRSNPNGSVGFLKEPERINVLLSRARHGLILIGNATHLLHAKSKEAQHHWGTVIGALERTGSVLRGLPAKCQVHGTEVLLNNVAAFQEHAPQGGCNLQCGKQLPCGHVCELHCHPNDLEHQHVKCAKLVYQFCSSERISGAANSYNPASLGHFKCRCSADSKEACPTCIEIRKISDSELAALQKLEQAKLEEQRRAAVKQAQLQSKIQQLEKEQQALEAARTARQQEVKLELEAARLEKEVSRQVHQGAKELAAWEAEERLKSQADTAAADVAAIDMAEQQAKEREARQAMLQKEAQLQEQLAAARKRMQVERANVDRQLQAIENKKARKQQEAALQQTNVAGGLTTQDFPTVGVARAIFSGLHSTAVRY
eukprot:366472-Chlamydomonas_euryale.AAC.1